MVAPLNFQELDASGPGSPETFFQDTNGMFTVGQILVDIHRFVINILEYF